MVGGTPVAAVGVMLAAGQRTRLDPRRVSWSLAAIGLLAIGCGTPDSGPIEQASWAELDPCGGPDHPCTHAEVLPEARARTDSLAGAVGEHLNSPDDLQEAAEWLAQQNGVVSVATGPEAIRFRVRGGRGRWILVRTLASIAMLGAPTIPKPPRSRTGLSVAGPREPSVRETLVATPSAPGPALQASGTDQMKRALLLSPFRWQWEVQGDNDGLDEVEQLLQARDYRDGVELWTERLDPGNEACDEGAVRWKDCRTIGEMGSPTAYTTWDEYDFVYLMTHGAAVSDSKDKKSKTGLLTSWTVDDVGRERAEADEEDRQGDVEFIDSIGLEKGHVYVWGVEIDDIPLAGDAQTAEIAFPLQVILEAEREGPVPLNSALSLQERSFCRRALDSKPDSERIREASRQRTEEVLEGASGERQSSFAHMDALARINDNICGAYSKRVKTGPFIMLTTPFFKETYPDGIDDAVILISACSSGATEDKDLLNALAGDNTSVVGWSKSVGIGAAAEAGKLIARNLVQVDENIEDDSGLSVGQAIQAIRTLIDDARSSPLSREECRDPPPESAAQCALQHGTSSPLTVINDRPADALTGAMLAVVGDTAVRAREVVYLVDEAGNELRDGAVLEVVGMAGDGQADSVDLRIRVDGLRLEEEPREVNLHVDVETEGIDVEDRLDKEVADGVWELDYRLPLGRDHENGELVNFDVVANLPDDSDSRWHYRNIRLTSAECHWSASISGGPGDGNVAGYRGNARYVDSYTEGLDIDAMVQEGDPQPAAPWLRISLNELESRMPSLRELEEATSIELAIPGIRPGETGSWQRVWGILHVGHEHYPGNAEYLRRDVIGLPEGTGIGYLLTTNVTLTRHDDERIEGMFDARFLDLSRIPEEDRRPPGVGVHPLPDGEIRASGEFSMPLGGACSS